MGEQALLIALSSLGTVCLIPPLAWHIKCRNIPLMILMLWLIISTIKTLVDASVWGGEGFLSEWDGKIWCDIMVKLQVGTDSGVVCAVTAIVLNLYIILSANSLTVAWFHHPKRKLAIELIICLATPIFVMATNYIVTNSRYVVLRYFGCQFTYEDSWLVIILCTMWPLIWSLIASVVSVLTIIKYFKRRKEVRDILKITESGLSLRRFARLLVFCILIMLVMLPLSFYIFISGFKIYSKAFNWAQAHNSFFYNIILFLEVTDLYDRWVSCALAYVAFLVFGLGSEALKTYESALRALGFGPVLDKIGGTFEKRKLRLVDKMKSRMAARDQETASEISGKNVSRVECYELDSITNSSRLEDDGLEQDSSGGYMLSESFPKIQDYKQYTARAKTGFNSYTSNNEPTEDQLYDKFLRGLENESLLDEEEQDEFRFGVGFPYSLADDKSDLV